MSSLYAHNGHEAHYGNRIAVLSGDFDLRSDYEHPRRHTARILGQAGKIRVIVDHNETGTATTGTGDTVVRSIPRGWKSGDRTFAD